MATKTKKARRPTTRPRSAADRYASQVTAETTLKFGPEDSQLAAALRDAEGSFDQEIAAAKGTRRAIEHAAREAKPKLEANAKKATVDVDKAQAEINGNLARLPNAGALAGAATRDTEGTRSRLAEMLAAAKTETDQRARDAAAGEAHASSNARARLGDTKSKIADRLSAQAQEKGAFAQARTGELVENARGRSVTRRGQTLTARERAADRKSREVTSDLDRESRETIEAQKQAAARDKERKDKRQTPEKTEKAKTSISRALANAQRLKAEGGGRRRSEVAGLLVNGRDDVTIKNAPKDGPIGGQEYKAGDPLTTPIKIPGVKGTQEVWASVALDLAYDGHLSTRNMQKLQAMGYSVRELGLNTAGRSGTKQAKEKADRDAAKAAKNPVRPKKLKDGAAALGRGGGILPQGSPAYRRVR